MNLPEYIKTLSRQQAIEFRKRLVVRFKISQVYARHLCNGRNKLPSKYAVGVEKLTDGAVARYVSAPDHYHEMDCEESYARVCKDIAPNMD